MMRRIAVIVLFLLPSLAPAQVAESPGLKARVKAWAQTQEWSMSGSFTATVFEQDAWKEVLGKDYLPLIRFSSSWYPVTNLSLETAVGGMYEEGAAIGSITGEASGEDFKFYAAPVEINLRYRFRFLDNQILVPSVWAGADWWYFKEDNDFSPDVEGTKTGYRLGADLGLLLDALDPPAAHTMKRDYGVNDTYLCLGYERAAVGDRNQGLSFTGDYYLVSLRFDLGPAHASR